MTLRVLPVLRNMYIREGFVYIRFILKPWRHK